MPSRPVTIVGIATWEEEAPPSGGTPGKPTHPIYIPIYPAHPIAPGGEGKPEPPKPGDPNYPGYNPPSGGNVPTPVKDQK